MNYFSCFGLNRGCCIDNQIGIVRRGKFSEIIFDERKFCETIEKVIATRRATKPEDVLRKSILVYLGVSVLLTRFNKTSLYQSLFYQKWLEYIKNLESFKNAEIEALERKKKELELFHKAAEKQKVLRRKWTMG